MIKHIYLKQWHDASMKEKRFVIESEQSHNFNTNDEIVIHKGDVTIYGTVLSVMRNQIEIQRL